MNEEKSWGSTVLGWFVAMEAEEGTTPPTEGALKSPPPPPVHFQGEVPAAAGGNVDCDGVFEAAGIGAEERDRFAKAGTLLGSLPSETDPVVRKRIVEASLKAFGVPIDKIIEAGAQSIQALEGYLQIQTLGMKEFEKEAQTLIADYEQKIRQAQGLLARRIADQQAVQKACNDRKLEIQKVLEFFGQEAVGRVVRESPKLIDPSLPKRKD
jgi:hypothetical protein